MNCDEVVELVTAYLGGALSPADEERFVEHVAACEGCETYLHQFRATTNHLGGLGPVGLSTRDCEHLLEAFRTWPRS